MLIQSIEKILIKILLFFTWKSNYGSRLKYHFKKRPFNFEYLNWSIRFYKGRTILKTKSWKSFSFLNRYSESVSDFFNEGVADPFLVSLDNNIFVLYEAIRNGKGEIWCKK